MVTDADALDQIAALMDREEWDADTLDDIAAIVRQTQRDGLPREIRDVRDIVEDPRW